MVLRIHGKDESVVRFRQGAPLQYTKLNSSKLGFFCPFFDDFWHIFVVTYPQSELYYRPFLLK